MPGGPSRERESPLRTRRSGWPPERPASPQQRRPAQGAWRVCKVAHTAFLTPRARLAQAHMAAFQDLQYCKTDLIAAKGIVFCKYAKASAALRALEAVNATGQVPPATPLPPRTAAAPRRPQRPPGRGALRTLAARAGRQVLGERLRAACAHARR